jgi:uncharacterized protein with GYD domain
VLYLVIVEKFTPEGRKNLNKVWEWQKELDDWLITHGAKFKSVKHFLTLIGEPTYETWLEYPNYAALDEDAEKAKEFAQDPKWQELMVQMNVYFERIGSRIVKPVLIEKT